MPEFSDPKIQDQWEKTGRDLRARRHPSKRKAIDEMDLDELLEAKEKYLVWIKKNAKHPDAPNKKHIYQNYLLPRIEQLKADRELLNNARVAFDMQPLESGLQKQLVAAAN